MGLSWFNRHSASTARKENLWVLSLSLGKLCFKECSCEEQLRTANLVLGLQNRWDEFFIFFQSQGFFLITQFFWITYNSEVMETFLWLSAFPLPGLHLLFHLQWCRDTVLYNSVRKKHPWASLTFLPRNPCSGDQRGLWTYICHKGGNCCRLAKQLLRPQLCLMKDSANQIR